MPTEEKLLRDINVINKTAMYYKGIELVNTKNVVMSIETFWEKGEKGRYEIKYFDENGICRVASLEDIANRNIRLSRIYINKNYTYCFFREWDGPIFVPKEQRRIKALDEILYCRINPGDPAEKLVELAKSVCIEGYSGLINYSEFARLFQKIETPIFDGEKNYFDFIRISICCGTSVTKEDVIRYQKELNELVVEKLENNRSFQKYNIPIGMLRLSNLSLTQDKRLEYVFELKPELRKLLEDNE